MGPPPTKRARPVAGAAAAGGELAAAAVAPGPRPSLAPSARGNGAGVPPAVGSKRLRDSSSSDAVEG
jgi:hypothetical protein